MITEYLILHPIRDRLESWRRPACPGDQAMKLALEGIGHAFLGRAVFEKIDFTLQNGEWWRCSAFRLRQDHAAADRRRLVDPLRGRIRRA